MKYKYIIFIFIFSIFVLLISCEYYNAEIEEIPVNADISEHKDEWGDLYSLAGLSELKIKTAKTDPFNLQLSHNDYFYYDDIYVEITCAIENAEIYYTTDASNPKRDSNLLYTEPVLIEKGDNNAPVVLKVVAFLDDSDDNIKSDILTHTYFVSEQINSRFDENIYVFSISSDPYNLYDYDYGILVAGRLRDEWQQANRRKQPIPSDPANYNLRGRESERECYVEVLNSKGELLITQSIGIRVRGGWSRALPRKAFGLYARSEYDPIFDKFYYDFFRFFDFNGKTTIRGKTEPVESYSALMLRNGGNNDYDSAVLREELSVTLAKKAGFLDYKEVAPAAVFLNGEYYGFYWLEQFYPESYFIDNYGEVNKSNIEIKYWWEEPDSAGISKDETFEAYSQLVDLDNYMLYYAFEIFIDNTDWPHNNLKLWRYIGADGKYINPYYDGKYRMLIYDAEVAWAAYGRSYRERTIARVRNSSPSFGNLMRRTDMVEKFCNQMFDLIYSVFTYESVSEELDKLVALYEHEMQITMDNRIINRRMRHLQSQHAAIKEFANNRAVYVIQDMQRSFKLGSELYHIEVTGKNGASVKLNTLELIGTGTLESHYFAEHSVKLSADAQQFDYWLINGEKYKMPEVILNNEIAHEGNITAEIFLK